MEEDIFVIGYVPLIGAQIQAVEKAYLTSNVKVLKPSLYGWEFINESDIFRELQRQGISIMIDEKAIPLCIEFTIGGISVDENEKFKNAILKKAEHIILSLQLYKEGWFFNPLQYQIYFVANNKGEVKKGRYPGPYRQTNFDVFAKDFPAPYVFTPEEMAIDNAAAANTDFTVIYELVKKYYDLDSNAAIDFVIKNFRMSYNFFGASGTKANYLFTLIDSLLGDVNARKIHTTSVKLTFKQRAKIILSDFNNYDGEIDWLTGLEGARAYRNLIAHGREDNLDVLVYIDKNMQRLQSVARHLLRKYIAFYFFETTTENSQFPSDKLLSEKFYLMIEAVAQQKKAAIELLSEINKACQPIVQADNSSVCRM